MNRIKTLILLASLSGLLLAIGYYSGGKNGMTIALAIAVVMNFASYWFSDKIVLAMHQAQEITEDQGRDLFDMVRQLTQQANLPMPRIYIIPDPSPNAFATGRDPNHAVVAVTEGILQLLDRDELAGVISHELGHVKNRDILIQSVAATLGAAITYLAYFGRFFGSSEGGQRGSALGSLLMVILAPLAALVIQMAISRSREYLADRTGAEICGHPMWLAHALDKLRRGVDQVPMDTNEATAHMFIVNPFSGGGISRLFSTHPPLEDRIERLQEMAGY
jgi:heat shock protein HtpX